MADKSKFSDFAIKLIKSEDFNGESMIATSRAILDASYSDEEYGQEFMSIFILIDDEAGEVALDGFDLYNYPSKRYAIGRSSIEKVINIATGGAISRYPDFDIEDKENIISYIRNNYMGNFLDSIRSIITRYDL